MYIAIPHLSPIGLSVIHQADEKHVDVTFQRTRGIVSERNTSAHSSNAI